MCIEDRIRGIREKQALAIVEVLQAAGAAGRDVTIKKRADGWHVESEHSSGDHSHVGADLTDALAQYTMTVSARMGLVFGSSELDELGAEADQVVVIPEAPVAFAVPIDPQSDEYMYALSVCDLDPLESPPRAVSDTEPPPRLWCDAEGCDQEPGSESSLCAAHLAAYTRAVTEASQAIGIGDAQ